MSSRLDPRKHLDTILRFPEYLPFPFLSEPDESLKHLGPGPHPNGSPQSVHDPKNDTKELGHKARRRRINAYKSPTGHWVDIWHDPNGGGNWVVQTKDAEGHQVGESTYIYQRDDALDDAEARVHDLEAGLFTEEERFPPQKPAEADPLDIVDKGRYSTAFKGSGVHYVIPHQAAPQELDDSVLYYELDRDPEARKLQQYSAQLYSSGATEEDQLVVGPMHLLTGDESSLEAKAFYQGRVMDPDDDDFVIESLYEDHGDGPSLGDRPYYLSHLGVTPNTIANREGQWGERALTSAVEEAISSNATSFVLDAGSEQAEKFYLKQGLHPGDGHQFYLTGKELQLFVKSRSRR